MGPELAFVDLVYRHGHVCGVLHWYAQSLFARQKNVRLTKMSLHQPTDTFLASFIVPILPYILEGRVGLDPSQTQTMTSWLLSGNAAVSVLIRMPLAHFADQSTTKRSWFLWGLGLAFISTIATAFGSSCMSKISRSVGKNQNS